MTARRSGAGTGVKGPSSAAAPAGEVEQSQDELLAESYRAAAANGELVDLAPWNPDPAFLAVIGGLKELRKPFPPEMIEHLPKPMWKNAWEGLKGSSCGICNGYHVAQNAIHLDYVGHANCTNRLLEVDPFWDWEPLAYTAEGLPLFDRSGGLWIKLTVCGVTRLGYGDGGAPKEIIGDAIRNAAMRFGVALDLWSKIDLHQGINTGDGEASRRERDAVGRPNQQRSGGDRPAGRGRDNQVAEHQGATPRAANQDALDSLQEVCDSNGLDTRSVADRYFSDYDVRINDAHPDDILNFAAILIVECTPDPAVDGEGADGEPAGVDGSVHDSERDSAGSGDAGSGDGESDPGRESEDHVPPVDPKDLF